MNRRVWIGVLAGLLAATLVGTIAFGAYRAGQRNEVVTRTVTDGSGEVVRVIDGHGWGWGYGPGPGFLLIPLLGIGLIVLLARGGRRWGPGPGGWCGPGPDYRQQHFEEWHKRMHSETA